MCINGHPTMNEEKDNAQNRRESGFIREAKATIAGGWQLASFVITALAVMGLAARYNAIQWHGFFPHMRKRLDGMKFKRFWHRILNVFFWPMFLAFHFFQMEIGPILDTAKQQAEVFKKRSDFFSIRKLRLAYSSIDDLQRGISRDFELMILRLSLFALSQASAFCVVVFVNWTLAPESSSG